MMRRRRRRKRKMVMMFLPTLSRGVYMDSVAFKKNYSKPMMI